MMREGKLLKFLRIKFLEQIAPMDNRQTSLPEVSGTHTQYLWWLAKYYVSCMPTPLSSPTIAYAHSLLPSGELVASNALARQAAYFLNYFCAVKSGFLSNISTCSGPYNFFSQNWR